MPFDSVKCSLNLMKYFCPVSGLTGPGIDLPLAPSYALRMRWDALFEDLEGQLAEPGRLALDAEISDRVRAEMVNIALADRLRGSLGCVVAAHLTCGEAVQGTLQHAGADALLLVAGGYQMLIPYAAVGRYVGIGRHSAAEESTVRRKIGLAHALRSLARDREELVVVLSAGEGAMRLAGVIDRVGKDFLDLAAVAPGEARRSGRVTEFSTIPFAAVAMVRSSRGDG